MKFKLIESFDKYNYDFDDIIFDYLCNNVSKDEIRKYAESNYNENELRKKLINIYPNEANNINKENYEELLDDYVDNISIYEDEEAFEYFKYEKEDELNEIIDNILSDCEVPDYDDEGRRIY